MAIFIAQADVRRCNDTGAYGQPGRGIRGVVAAHTVTQPVNVDGEYDALNGPHVSRK